MKRLRWSMSFLIYLGLLHCGPESTEQEPFGLQRDAVRSQWQNKYPHMDGLLVFPFAEGRYGPKIFSRKNG